MNLIEQKYTSSGFKKPVFLCPEWETATVIAEGENSLLTLAYTYDPKHFISQKPREVLWEIVNVEPDDGVAHTFVSPLPTAVRIRIKNTDDFVHLRVVR